MSFFFIFSTVLFIIYLYTGIRLIPSLFKFKTAVFIWVLLILSLMTLMLHIYLRVTGRYPDISHLSAWIGYSVLGLMSYLFCLTIFRDFLIVCSRMGIKLKQLIQFSEKLPLNKKRRHFLFKASGYAIAALGTTASAYGFKTALQPPEVVKINMTAEQNFKNLKGLKIVQLTDLHAGPTIGYDYVKKVCDTIQHLKADLIVFTGDLADGAPQDLDHAVSPLMDIQAPLGKFFVTGNHEYYSGVDRWLHKVADMGFHPLMNEHRVLRYNKGLLTLAGVTDIRAGRFLRSHKCNARVTKQ